jgi:hypothetical protein
MNIHPVGAELFQTDRQTDITELIVAFRNFANAPKNCSENTQYRPTMILKVIFYKNLLKQLHSTHCWNNF